MQKKGFVPASWVRARVSKQETVNGYGVEWTIAACQGVILLMDIERTTSERLPLATMPEKFTPDHFSAGILQFQPYTQSFLGVEGAHLDYVARGINGDRVLPIVPGRIRPSGTPCWKGHIARLIAVMFGPVEGVDA